MDTRNGPSGARAKIEGWSAAPLAYLAGLPRWMLLVGIFVLLAVGMIGTGVVGALGMIALMVVLGWFAYLNWPMLNPGGRLLRVAALLVLAVFAIAHLARF
ncbi:DUF6703 family protein [Spirillospora sp. CA-294931]|uniref:DUF6703 family protein n=1 Tax=Spirillospora sp. CA-294931 TaxID=3240042 RepID=UPI003D8BC055